jgi:hypothetical protein
MKISRPLDQGAWTFGARNRSIWSEDFTLSSDGRIVGYSNPNEFRWLKRDDSILLIDSGDAVTAELKKMPDDGEYEEWAGPVLKDKSVIHYIRRKYTTIGCFFRTHFWDESVERTYLTLSEAWHGDVIISADMTRRFKIPEKYKYLEHNLETFRELGLPLRPSPGKAMWHNGDYIFYELALKTDFDYTIISEYDTYVSADLDSIVAVLLQQNVDFSAPGIGRAWEHWSWTQSQQQAIDKWIQFYGIGADYKYIVMKSFFPFVFISKKAAHALYAKRLEFNRILGMDQYEVWPFCESFVPTELTHLKFKILDLSAILGRKNHLTLTDAKNLDEAAMSEPSLIHPVLAGDRFVSKLFAHAGELSKTSPERGADWLENRVNDHFSPYEKEKFGEEMKRLRLKASAKTETD